MRTEFFVENAEKVLKKKQSTKNSLALYVRLFYN